MLTHFYHCDSLVGCTVCRPDSRVIYLQEAAYVNNCSRRSHKIHTQYFQHVTTEPEWWVIWNSTLFYHRISRIWSRSVNHSAVRFANSLLNRCITYLRTKDRHFQHFCNGNLQYSNSIQSQLLFGVPFYHSASTQFLNFNTGNLPDLLQMTECIHFLKSCTRTQRLGYNEIR
jgi:hypothetical protein